MSMGATIVRVVIGIIGLSMMALALWLLFFNGAFLVSLWLFVGGAVLLVGVVIERTRYRSQAAESGNMTPGPGGGETMPLEARFRPTDEVFVDPTSKRRMRVYLDSTTGERRYVAEAFLPD